MIAVEPSPWKAPENAASTLHGLVSAIGAPARLQRESRESSSLRQLLSCDCAALQAHRRTKLRSCRPAAGSRQMLPPQHQRAYPPVRRSFPSTSNCRHEPASIWNQESEIRIVTTLPLKRCAWALSPPTASHLQGLILLERGDAQYVSHLFEDRELQQTAGINYYMRDIVHVIALFDQK